MSQDEEKHSAPPAAGSDILGSSAAVEGLQGEVVQVRAMSSAQAAAILCGIPGSVEAVLNN